MMYVDRQHSKLIETLRGRWDDMVYTLPLGVDTNTAIKLELGYLGGMVQRQFFSRATAIATAPLYWIPAVVR